MGYPLDLLFLDAISAVGWREAVRHGAAPGAAARLDAGNAGGQPRAYCSGAGARRSNGALLRLRHRHPRGRCNEAHPHIHPPAAGAIALIEFCIVVPAFVFLILVIFQFVLIYRAKSLLDFATLQAGVAAVAASIIPNAQRTGNGNWLPARPRRTPPVPSPPRQGRPAVEEPVAVTEDRGHFTQPRGVQRGSASASSMGAMRCRTTILPSAMHVSAAAASACRTPTSSRSGHLSDAPDRSLCRPGDCRSFRPGQKATASARPRC